MLGTVVFAGAGGGQNLCQSSWIRDWADPPQPGLGYSALLGAAGGADWLAIA